MPALSRFYGIRIAMHWNDHQPPHFHAEYSGEEALVGIQPVCVLEGRLSRRARCRSDEALSAGTDGADDTLDAPRPSARRSEGAAA